MRASTDARLRGRHDRLQPFAQGELALQVGASLGLGAAAGQLAFCEDIVADGAKLQPQGLFVAARQRQRARLFLPALLQRLHQFQRAPVGRIEAGGFGDQGFAAGDFSLLLQGQRFDQFLQGGGEIGVALFALAPVDAAQPLPGLGDAGAETGHRFPVHLGGVDAGDGGGGEFPDLGDQVLGHGQVLVALVGEFLEMLGRRRVGQTAGGVETLPQILARRPGRIVQRLPALAQAADFLGQLQHGDALGRQVFGRLEQFFARDIAAPFRPALQVAQFGARPGQPRGLHGRQAVGFQVHRAQRAVLLGRGLQRAVGNRRFQRSQDGRDGIVRGVVEFRIVDRTLGHGAGGLPGAALFGFARLARRPHRFGQGVETGAQMRQVGAVRRRQRAPVLEQFFLVQFVRRRRFPAAERGFMRGQRGAALFQRVEFGGKRRLQPFMVGQQLARQRRRFRRLAAGSQFGVDGRQRRGDLDRLVRSRRLDDFLHQGAQAGRQVDDRALQRGLGLQPLAQAPALVGEQGLGGAAGAIGFLPGAVEVGDLVDHQRRTVDQLLRQGQAGQRQLFAFALPGQGVEALLHQFGYPAIGVAHGLGDALEFDLAVDMLGRRQPGVGKTALHDEIGRAAFVAGQRGGFQQAGLARGGLRGALVDRRLRRGDFRFCHRWRLALEK
jgi:hypothetical protein